MHIGLQLVNAYLTRHRSADASLKQRDADDRIAVTINDVEIRIHVTAYADCYFSFYAVSRFDRDRSAFITLHRSPTIEDLKEIFDHGAFHAIKYEASRKSSDYYGCYQVDWK